MNRRPYLDWLRGLAVLIMIEGHTIDAWTRAADRGREAYHLAILVAGFGAPIFLFLAGVSLVLAAGSRVRRGATAADTTRAALRRSAWILALAFLFRLQSFAISGGTFPASLLKVDILNVMAVSMAVGALLWSAARADRSRALLFAAAAAAFAMLTPLVRGAAWLAPLPDPLEAYLRPAAGSSAFTLFPWAGFLVAGAAVGAFFESRGRELDRRSVLALLATGATIAAAGYGAALLPPLYANTTFWTGSPTFFLVRLGIVIATIPAAFVLARGWASRPLQEFGRASLLVYWIHVEMVYGILSTPLHRRLPLELVFVAMSLFALLLFGLVRLNNRRSRRGRSPEPARSGKSPIPAT